MIKIKQKKVSKKKVTPYYLLKYNYMIGDGNGDTSEIVELSVDNPFIERYCKLLNSLKPTKGTWGVMLRSEDIDKCLQEGQITKDDYDFLMVTIFEGVDDVDKNPYFDENNNYLFEFFEGVRAEVEYSFLVFEGVELKYSDEYGVKHDTYFED